MLQISFLTSCSRALANAPTFQNCDFCCWLLFTKPFALLSDASCSKHCQTFKNGINLQGGGLAYGTKEGKLRILRHDPRPEARTLATCQQPRGLDDELREAESISEDDVLL